MVVFRSNSPFTDRSLTPQTDAIARALTDAGCGTAGWKTGAKQSVFPAGCMPFGVPDVAQCAAEFDVVKLHGGKLFLGARPEAGNICALQRRPLTAGTAALIQIVNQ
ncbi:unnamed protein product [Hapterophycus canaliculatus]